MFWVSRYKRFCQSQLGYSCINCIELLDNDICFGLSGHQGYLHKLSLATFTCIYNLWTYMHGAVITWIALTILTIDAVALWSMLNLKMLKCLFYFCFELWIHLKCEFKALFISINIVAFVFFMFSSCRHYIPYYFEYKTHIL